jgi:hypothetical protein
LAVPALQAQSDAQQAWLWRFQPRDAAEPSYLFAVLHHPNPAFIAAFRHLDPWFNANGSLATVWPADAASTRIMEAAQRSEDGKTMRKTYRDQAYAPVAALVSRRLGDDLASYANWQPIYLRRRLLDAGRAPVGRQFFDHALVALAQERGKPIRQLVPPTKLALLLEAVDLSEQTAALLDFGRHNLEYEAAYDAFAGPYLAADWDGLHALARRWEGDAPAARTLDGLALIAATNLQQLAEQGPGFFAVDAELLGGEAGVLARMRQLGLIPVPVPCPEYAAQLKREIGASLAPPPTGGASQSEPVSALPGESKALRKPLFEGLEQRTSERPLRPWEDDPFADLYRYGEADTSFLKRWTTYRGPDGDYRARFPYKPNVDANLYRAEGGTVDVKLAALNDPETSLYYLVSRTAYPERFRFSDPVRFFDDALEDTRMRFEGRVLADRPISTPLYRGREYVLAIPGGRYVRGRMLLADQTLYHLTLIGQGQGTWSKEAAAFLDGFRLYRSNVRAWAVVEGNGFRARMPLSPVQGKQRMETPGGPVDVEAWSLEDPLSGIQYVISRSQYPPEASKRSEAFLDRMVYGTAARLRGTVTDESKIRTGRRKGREVHVRAGDKDYRIRFYLQGSDLVQVLVGASPQALNGSDVAYFLDAFRFY